MADVLAVIGVVDASMVKLVDDGPLPMGSSSHRPVFALHGEPPTRNGDALCEVMAAGDEGNLAAREVTAAFPEEMGDDDVDHLNVF